MKNNQGGGFAENMAAVFYRLHGFRIAARNYVTGRGTGAGEIDLIVCCGKLLVFVEVKKRKNLDKAAYAIKPEQQRRIWKAAENFIKTHPQYQDCNIRFDAFLFVSWRCFRHVADAWRL